METHLTLDSQLIFINAFRKLWISDKSKNKFKVCCGIFNHYYVDHYKDYRLRIDVLTQLKISKM